MKRLSILFGLLLFECLFSCSPAGKKQPTEDIKTLDTTISIAGDWLSEDYFNSIKEFGSPRKAQDGALFITIPNRTLEPTMMIYNFHEGASSLTILLNDDTYEIWGVYDDTIAELHHKIKTISQNNIKIGDRSFVKINPVMGDRHRLILEDVLFQGNYTNSDSQVVTFSKTGVLAGLDSLHFYSPPIDYFDAGMQVDQVALGKSRKSMELFGFEFSGDTLKLFELNCLTWEKPDWCVEVENGRLVYTLWKTRI